MAQIDLDIIKGMLAVVTQRMEGLKKVFAQEKKNDLFQNFSKIYKITPKNREKKKTK